MLFSRGDPTSIQILLDCFWDFGSISGLHMNVLKSNIYSVGVGAANQLDILSLSHLQQGLMPFCYFGIPFTARKLLIANYEVILQWIWAIVNGWCASTLSYAGCTKLVKSVLQGAQCFWLSIFPLPAAIPLKIVQLCCLFSGARVIPRWLGLPSIFPN